MSFFADNKTRQRLAVDGAMGLEPPLKRLRSVLGAEGDVGLGVGESLGLTRTGADPLSLAAYDTSLVRADARAWPLGAGAGLDAQLLGLSSSLDSLGSLGSLGTLGCLGLSGVSSTAEAFIERNLSNLDASQAMAFKDLPFLQGKPLVSPAGFPLPSTNARMKTKLCKHFIENNCKFKVLCNFAHSIQELKKIPDQGDSEGKLLLERYKTKAIAEVLFSVQALPVNAPAERKTKLCKHFIDGDCKFKEGCNFAHGIEELKKLTEGNDEMGKDFLERYKAKAGFVSIGMNGKLAQAIMQTGAHPSTSTVAKTKLCMFFVSGNCKFKNICTFAHSIEELRSLPGEDDAIGKALLEQYRSKMAVDKSDEIETKEALTSSVMTAMEIEKPEQAQKMEPLPSVTSKKTEVEKPDEAQIKEALAPGAMVVAEIVKNTVLENTSVDAQKDQKIESLSSAATQMRVDDNKSVRLLKTKMCKHFFIGACKFNKNCTFAHAIEELKPPPPPDANDSQQTTQSVELSFQLADGKGNEGPTENKEDKQGALKSKLCRFFSEGTCRFGNACAYIHNVQLHAISSNGGAPQSGALQVPGEIKATYKTRQCKMWEKEKTCSFGSKCHFAHGAEELRQRSAPSNSLTHGILELEVLARAARAQQMALSSQQLALSTQQLAHPSSASYSYDITETNWRPFHRGTEEALHGLGGAGLGVRLFRGTEEALHGLGGMGVGVVNERMLDTGAAEAMHLRGLLHNYGQLEPASSSTSLGGANAGLTRNVFTSLPSWSTREPLDTVVFKMRSLAAMCTTHVLSLTCKPRWVSHLGSHARLALVDS